MERRHRIRQHALRLTLGWCAATMVLATTVLATAAQGQLTGTAKWADSVRGLVEEAYRTSDAAAMREAHALIDRVLAVVPNDPMLLHYKGYVLYRSAAPLLGSGRRAEAKSLLEQADAALEASSESLAWPESHALRSAILGQLIGVSGNSPVVAMRNGMKAGTLMDKALELGPENPRVWILKGSGELYKPSIFGGGTEAAERSLAKAITLLASDRPASPRPAWGAIDAHLWMGQVHAEAKRVAAARASYERVLALAPDFAWVKHTLLPALDKP